MEAFFFCGPIKIKITGLLPSSFIPKKAVKAGDKGDLVVQVQDCLVEYGYLEKITGVYDSATVAAVKAFQEAHGLKVDGKCGEMTLQVLFGY